MPKMHNNLAKTRVPGWMAAVHRGIQLVRRILLFKVGRFPPSLARMT